MPICYMLNGLVQSHFFLCTELLANVRSFCPVRLGTERRRIKEIKQWCFLRITIWNKSTRECLSYNLHCSVYPSNVRGNWMGKHTERLGYPSPGKAKGLILCGWFIFPGFRKINLFKKEFLGQTLRAYCGPWVVTLIWTHPEPPVMFLTFQSKPEVNLGLGVQSRLLVFWKLLLWIRIPVSQRFFINPVRERYRRGYFYRSLT